MILDNFHFLKIASVLAGMVGSLVAGDFVAPAEGPVAFRRDRVPLDAETMIKLSTQLTTLAGGLDADTAAKRRGAAQMLALAIALDPANSRARTVMEQFEKGRHQPDNDPEKIHKSREGMWNCLGWLETSEAGPAGQALGACLKDVLALADPEAPRAEALRAAGEQGRWVGWVADTASYEFVKAVVEPAPNDGAVDVPKAKSGILLQEATVYLPLWRKVPDSNPDRWQMAAAPLGMKASAIQREEGEPDKGEEKPFSITIGRPVDDAAGVGEGNPLDALVPAIRNLLLQQHGKLPVNCRVRIDSPELGQSLQAKKRQSVSAAAAVLASAAISGREPAATIIGQIDSTGAFKVSTGFWEQLSALRTATGRRLVLPTAAAPYLQSMLAMEYPQFFLSNEVLLASNFKELLDLSAKSPDDAIGKISTQFQEIRAKAGNQPTGQYVANSFVRRRLMDIAKAAPYHASASMLAVQAAGNRPITISRPVLIAELRRAIEPMAWLFNREESVMEAAEINQIGATFETCSGELKRLERYVEKDDRQMVERVVEMVALLRPLDRAARARTGPEDWSAMNTLQSAFAVLAKAHQVIADELAEVPANSAPASDR